MPSNDPFSGDGFNREDFEPGERAVIRELVKSIERAWPTIRGADEMAKGVQSLGKVVAGLAIVGGVIAFLVKNGFF